EMNVSNRRGGVSQGVRKRTFLTAMATMPSGKKVRFRPEDGDGKRNRKTKRDSSHCFGVRSRPWLCRIRTGRPGFSAASWCQFQPPQPLGEPWVAPQVLEVGMNFQPERVLRAHVVHLLQPGECLVFVAQPDVDQEVALRCDVAPLRQLLEFL